MKIGTKILLGFGTMILFLAIIVVVVLAENISTINSVGEMEQGSDVSGQQALDILKGAGKSSLKTLIAVIILAIISVGAAVPFAFYIRKSITEPISMQMRFLKQVGKTGDLNFSPEDWKMARAAATAKDETGEMLTAFMEMLEQLMYYGEILEQMSERDMSMEIKKLSDRDTMGTSLETMLKNFNEIFGEISDAASQVANSSGEIAAGSQVLAEGTTEQAAAVEELTQSICNVSEQAENSTLLAEETVTEVSNTGCLIKESLEYMQEMTAAMAAIEESSAEIAKVISVIDSIAFQTNILALNAAVEAARAGQHGKGFTVVANEVRSLASKSASAANETSMLIDKSVKNVKHGSEIADKTSESLTKVGEIAGKNVISISNLGESSKQQSYAIDEINTGIEQISTVIQQNSATSQESSAASQIMSGQAYLLQQMINKFKLRKRSETYTEEQVPILPAAAAGDEGMSFGKY